MYIDSIRYNFGIDVLHSARPIQQRFIHGSHAHVIRGRNPFRYMEQRLRKIKWLTRLKEA